MKYVIFDLDGCLADDRRRLPLIDFAAPDPWEAYHVDCENDPLINSYLLQSTKHCQPIIFTARPEKFRAQTERWLKEVAKLDDCVGPFMREDGCLKSSPEIKGNFLETLFKLGIKQGDIVMAYDDRDDVLEVYKSYGLFTRKVSYPTEPNLSQKPKNKAVDNLEAGAKTFRERNRKYGDSYLTFGPVMSGLFPKGLAIKSGDVDAFNRLGIYVQIISKCCRYATSISNGGHEDSAHDIMVYGAMLQEVTHDEG